MKRLIKQASDLYKIYQIDADNKLWREVLMGSDWLKKRNIEVSINDYEKVYELESTGLEEVYRTLNIKHPADYKARSLSVGDVIAHDGTYYFVDTFGFSTDVIK